MLQGASLEQARAIAERARLAVRTSEALDATPVSVSIGVASRLPGEPRDELLARADAALYRAKANGRDRVAIAGSPLASCGTP